MCWQDIDSYVHYFSIFCNRLGYFDSTFEEAAEGARAPSAVKQRIKAECLPNSEMEFESELEYALGESARSDQLLICVPLGVGLDLQCLAIKAGSRKNTNCLTPTISGHPETLVALEASVGRAPLPRYQA
jgi:hypothetical protein